MYHKQLKRTQKQQKSYGWLPGFFQLNQGPTSWYVTGLQVPCIDVESIEQLKRKRRQTIAGCLNG